MPTSAHAWPLRSEPSAPIDQQAVAVDAQHASLDALSAADREVVAGRMWLTSRRS